MSADAETAEQRDWRERAEKLLNEAAAWREAMERDIAGVEAALALRELQTQRERLAGPALADALEGLIYASDQCRGHRDCGHPMEPWQRARAALRAAGRLGGEK